MDYRIQVRDRDYEEPYSTRKRFSSSQSSIKPKGVAMKKVKYLFDGKLRSTKNEKRYDTQ